MLLYNQDRSNFTIIVTVGWLTIQFAHWNLKQNQFRQIDIIMGNRATTKCIATALWCLFYRASCSHCFRHQYRTVLWLLVAWLPASLVSCRGQNRFSKWGESRVVGGCWQTRARGQLSHQCWALHEFFTFTIFLPAIPFAHNKRHSLTKNISPSRILDRSLYSLFCWPGGRVIFGEGYVLLSFCPAFYEDRVGFCPRAGLVS